MLEGHRCLLDSGAASWEDGRVCQEVAARDTGVRACHSLLLRPSPLVLFAMTWPQITVSRQTCLMVVTGEKLFML